MRLERKAAVATLALLMGTSMAMARGPQGPPPDQDRGAMPGGDGPDGPGGPRDGMRMRRGMHPDGPDARGGHDEDRGRGGHGGRWGPGGGMGMQGGPGEFRLGRLLNDPDVRQQIGVSPEQAAKIRQQEADFAKAEIRNRADLQVKHIDLRELLTAEKPDRAAIDAKLQEVGAAQLAMEKAAIHHHLDMRDALTPDQRQKLEQWMKDRHDRQDQQRGPREGMRGNRGGAPPPGGPGAGTPGQPPPR